MLPTATDKIVEIDSHVGCACSGLIADSKTLIDRARVEAQVCISMMIIFDLLHTEFKNRIFERCFFDESSLITFINQAFLSP